MHSLLVGAAERPLEPLCPGRILVPVMLGEISLVSREWEFVAAERFGDIVWGDTLAEGKVSVENRIELTFPLVRRTFLEKVDWNGIARIGGENGSVVVWNTCGSDDSVCRSGLGQRGCCFLGEFLEFGLTNVLM